MKLPTKALLIFSLITNIVLAQQKEKTERKRIFLGVDLVQPISQFLGKSSGYSAVVSVPVYKKWQAAGEVGIANNQFDTSGWKGNVSGVFGSAGANWVVSQDDENPNMNFYLGGRLAFSAYKQKINQFLIQGYNTVNAKGSLPQSNAVAFWLEPLAGARVPIRESNFYIDASARLCLLLSHSGGFGITPIAIPGFGNNNNGLNFRLVWAIGYTF